MKKTRRKPTRDRAGGIRAILLSLCLIMVLGLAVYAEEASPTAADATKKLQNGSFENVPSFTGYYSQPDHNNVPAWNTTAYNTTGTNGKIELFRYNPSTYVGYPLKPTDGEYAAELNADEESSLYQVVKTTESSLYEWGLDHGSRTGKDTMALVIGPKQSVNPSKPSKDGRDQFMQMVDWLNIGNNVAAGAEPQQYTVYSKKFAASGAFEDNAGNNAFSLTPSTIYTEEWHIWVMASQKIQENGYNKWYSYGSNDHGSAGSENESGSTNVDTSKYYLYTVPAGQAETLFAFVSVDTTTKQPTFGNFLDNINFQLYHPLSGSSTTHGSAVVGGSDGTTEGEGANNGHSVTVDDKLTTYITDGQPLKVQAVVKKADVEDRCEFVGLYYTTLDENSKPVTSFIQLAGKVIEDTGSLTEAEKKGKWVKSTNTAGDIIYTYYLENITCATDLHFVFIKSPTVTYDPNGGKAYVVERIYNTDEAPNVYSFRPATLSENAVDATSGATPGDKPKEMFIPPYVSKAAEGQNDGWKFMGWLLTGDTVENVPDSVGKVNADKLGSLLLEAEHTVACNYSVDGASGEKAAQYFKIINGNVSLIRNIIKTDNGEITGVLWQDNGAARAYANVHKGLTMVAQWRWRQAFIPQVGSGSNYSNSDRGGTVEITSVTNKSDKNYNASYESVGKSYHAETDETITVTATPKDKNYTFEGWYDEKGNLVTTKNTYTYIETKESVRTLYARFSGSVTQTYIRQVKNGDAWEDTEDDKIGTLGRYAYTDAPGTPISSTATAGTGYKFVGWYDSEGNKVPDSMLINNGATISYTTTGNATYYARFETGYTVYFKAQTQQSDGTYTVSNAGGTVSIASVKDVDGKSASSKASATQRFKFVGWYDKDGNLLSTDATYNTTTTAATNGTTYYARFNFTYTVSTAYLSFVAESEETQIPSVFDGRHAGTGKNQEGYGLDNKFGNTISTGFQYSIVDMSNVKTIQITVTVPNTAHVKVGGTGPFTGNGTAILSDSSSVTHNKGSIQKIKNATTLTYYWDATGLSANTTYGFIIDNLYAPGATAAITINGKSGTQVTSANGVVNTGSGSYRGSSHYRE